MGIRRWKLPESNTLTAGQLESEPGISAVLGAVLAARGITGSAETKEFLSDHGAIENPFVMADMQEAAARIWRAIEDGERICIYGDYDCDGVTSTVLLTSYLQSVGADVLYYVPSREKEGYGLNRAAIEMLRGQRVDLIVTVDNGISAHGEVDFANSLGMDVVITDHHTPRETLPNAVAVVNPHRHDCKSAFKELAGVGVAFKLVCALENAEAAELLEYYSDLVALGTIADVVPLTGENRVIAKHGIERLSSTEKAGITALLAAAGLSGKELSGESVAFGLAPRVNACGRMDCVDDVIELLLTDDMSYAEEIAALVNEQNERRKKIEEEIFLQCEGILTESPEILTRRLIVLWGEGWHHGVVGIVASKIMEKYGKPCILFSTDSEKARGSGRSLAGFSMIEAIAACKEHLTMFGGHTLAAGMSLLASSLPAFEADLQEFARGRYPVMPVPELAIDCVLPPEWMTAENMGSLSRLEPFGACNEQPLFLLSGMTLDGVYPTSDKKHLRIRFSWGNTQFYAVWFRMTEEAFPFSPGELVDAVAGITVSEYNGKPQLSVKIRDLRPVNVPQEHLIEENELYARHIRGEYSGMEREVRLPTRDDLAVLYRFLRRYGAYPYGTAALYYKLMNSGIGYFAMLVSLDVMEELGLITRTGENGAAVVAVVPDPPKVDIESSRILMNLRAEMSE